MEITREQFRERAREKVKSLEFAVTQTAFADSRSELEEELELARIALASLEAEPAGIVRHIELRGPEHPAGIHVSLYSRLDDGIELYTAPPAPTVPNECPAEIRELMASYSDALFDDEDAQEIWNACRAAMLNQEKWNG